MIRTIEIGNKEVRLSNNISWAMIYKDQFGHDIVSSLTPMLAAGLDLISGFLSDVDTSKPIDAVDLLKRIDGDVLIDADSAAALPVQRFKEPEIIPFALLVADFHAVQLEPPDAQLPIKAQKHLRVLFPVGKIL